MEPILDRAYLVTREMAEETLERIRADRDEVPKRLKPLFDFIEELLFDTELNVDSLRRWTEIHDRNVSTYFTMELGVGPWDYIVDRRFEIAARVLAASDLAAWRIGTNVGYDHPSSFSRAFKRWCGQSPTAYRRKAQAERAAETAAADETPPEPAEDPGVDLAAQLEGVSAVARALSGEAEPDEALATLRELQSIQARTYPRYWSLDPPSPAAERAESRLAEDFWPTIESWTPEAQVAAVESQSGFSTPAIFHKLCARSVEIGIDDPERGLYVAGLAEIGLEGLTGQLDEPLMWSFEARVQAIAGLALLRAGEDDDAAAAFAAADELLDAAGDDALLAVVSEVSFYKSTLLISQGKYDEARRALATGRELADRMVEILRRDGLIPDGPPA